MFAAALARAGAASAVGASRASASASSSARRAISSAWHPTRPLSPHLKVYRFESNMLSSVVFRGTGIAMFMGLSAGSILYLFNSHKYRTYVAALQAVPVANVVVKAGVAFPLAYHFLGGLRHLAWDNVIGNNPAWNRQTAIASGAAAGAVAAVAAFASWERHDE